MKKATETKEVVKKERKPILSEEQKAEGKGYVKAFFKGAAFTLGGIAVTALIGIVGGALSGSNHSDMIDD